MSETGGYMGFRGTSADTTEINALRFTIQSALSEVATAAVVKVVGVRSRGEVAPSGTVDVVILTHQIDGAGNTYPHSTIHNVPYSRSQNQLSGIILDPEVGDIGVIVCASRDISAVKENKTESQPGSLRRHDWADALYVGAVMAAAPQQYVQFTENELTLVSPTKIIIRAPAIQFEGNVTWNGNEGGGRGTMTLNMDVAASGSITSNGKHIDSTHVHSGVQVGGGNTGVPPV